MRYDFIEQVGCPMCGTSDAAVIGLRLNRSQGFAPKSLSGIAVSVKRCATCELVYADPMPVPENISDHYGVPVDDYWPAEYFSWSPAYFASEIETAKRLVGFRPGMRALDVGAGLGKSLKSLDAAGFDSYGIEPSAPFREQAIARMGGDPQKVQLASLEEAAFPAASFDFITFGAVLEHLYDPAAAIEKVLPWLTPGGVIQAEVPNSKWLVQRMVNSYFRLRGTNYVTNISPMHSPFHLYEFTLRSFAEHGRRAGYEMVDHAFMTCSIYHVPKILHPLFRAWMDRTKTGMQLTVWLRRL